MVLERLNLATRERRGAFENRLPLLDPALSLERYRQFLGRFFGYYAPLESRLRSSPQWRDVGLSYCERGKTLRLASDLLALGAAPDMVAALPHCRELPDVSSSARLLGCLYVIEGETLGGPNIRRHLDTRLGLTPDYGASFFRGDGHQTGPFSKAISARLTDFVQRSGGAGEIIAAANQTFVTIEAWLFPHRAAAEETQ